MPSSDKIVTAKAILQAQLELQRLGINKAMERLESTEPNSPRSSSKRLQLFTTKSCVPAPRPSRPGAFTT